MPPTTSPSAAAVQPAATSPATAPAAPASPDAGRSTSASRAAALKAKLETEAPAADPGAPAPGVGAASAPGGTPAPQTPPAQNGAGAAGGQADPLAAARAERLARINQVRAKEDTAEVDRERHRAAKAREKEVEELRSKLAKLEPMEAVFKSEDALLAAAEERGMSSEKLIQWMRKRLTDPAAIAQQSAKSEADKIREELAAERQKREELEQRLKDERTNAQAAHEAQARAQSFVEQAASKGESHPLSAAFLKRYGATAFVNYANQFVAPLLPEDYDLDQLHDVYEQLLDELQLGGAPAAAPANPGQQPPKKNGAAEAGTTLGNALTQERASVAEEIPLHRLPFRERERRLKEKLEREGG